MSEKSAWEDGAGPKAFQTVSDLNPSIWCVSKETFKCVVMDILPLFLQMLFMFISSCNSNSLVNPPLNRTCLSKTVRPDSF